VPGVALRTSFIVGFPGETEDDVRALVDFVGEAEFTHAGVFLYSHEEGTAAAALADDVPQAEKIARRERVMTAQAAVARRRGQAMVGRSTEVLVERVQRGGTATGRTAQQAPDIDGSVKIRGRARPGDLTTVRIVGADVYDLHAEVISTENTVDTPGPTP
jgi:ribosomal protein S12 methylthiotransferase